LGIEDQITVWFQQIAYNPMAVYATITALMVASSFGLPFPEEITLVSAGFLAYMALNPHDYPPPEVGVHGVNVHVTALVCSLAVILSDYFIYWLGKKLGPKIFEVRAFKRVLTPKRMKRVSDWVHKRGYWAAGAFRFMPGIRFPGHFTCGMLRLPVLKFLAVDGGAALISVPTQVYLVAYNGKAIIEKFKSFQIVLFGGIGAFLLIYFIYRQIKKKKRNEVTKVL